MLARYLHTVPVRYAAQDALSNLRLAMALRNFLHVSTRAHNLPHLAHLAQPGQVHPVLPHILQAVFGQHDPRAVGQATDVIEDATGRQAPGRDDLIMPDNDRPLESLSDMLHMLHGVLSGRSDYLPHDAIRQRYGLIHADYSQRPANVSWAAYSTTHPHADEVYDLLAHIAHLPHQGDHEGELRPLWEALQQHRYRALLGDPLHVLGLYDALHATATHPLFNQGTPSPVHHTASGLRDDLATSMRTTLLPALHEGL